MENSHIVNSYIVIQSWMRTELKLKGIELLIFAIIYGFSQDQNSAFTGSLQYLADWTGATRQGCLKALKHLQDQNLIKKHEIVKNNIKYCEYSTEFNTIKLGLIESVKLGLTNNINNINIISSQNNSSINRTTDLQKNINIDLSRTKRKRKSAKQKKENLEQEENTKIIQLLTDFKSNYDSEISKLLDEYVQVRKQKDILTSAQLQIILENLRKECGSNRDYMISCIRTATAGGWSQIVFENNTFKGSIKSSYGVKNSVDNTSKHNTGNQKINDDEFNEFNFKGKKDYLNNTSIADMTKKQKEFFDKYCLARDENGEIIKY